ncbi:MAG: hypothetical protein H6538_03205 [Bacteroidales bacterium]|nr:hypothetical protein [Bacteroidales bacterium]
MWKPSPPRKILRRMKYISDQEGILRRYFREQEGWEKHLSKTAESIISVLESEKYKHVIVLGSGWLLDFPMERILNYVERISLFDVHFPRQILKKAEALKGVECIQADITGGVIEDVYFKLKNKTLNFPFAIPEPEIEKEEGMLIISLNILNQLDILLADYILSRKPDSPGIEIDNFRKDLQARHISMLGKHPFILVTDCREILINTEGKVLEEKNLIYTELPSGDRYDEWEWEFDTQGLYNPNVNTVLKVKFIYSKIPQNL